MLKVQFTWHLFLSVLQPRTSFACKNIFLVFQYKLQKVLSTQLEGVKLLSRAFPGTVSSSVLGQVRVVEGGVPLSLRVTMQGTLQKLPSHPSVF